MVDKRKSKTIDKQQFDFIFIGLERIRTAVDGFADRCLAARPQDHYGMQMY